MAGERVRHFGTALALRPWEAWGHFLTPRQLSWLIQDTTVTVLAQAVAAIQASGQPARRTQHLTNRGMAHSPMQPGILSEYGGLMRLVGCRPYAVRMSRVHRRYLVRYVGLLV